MKVALLFAGQPRWITNPYPFKSHKREILDKYETDVFAHLWFDKNCKEYDFSVWSRMDKCPVNPDSIKLFTEMYNPKQLEVETPRKFFLSPESRALVDKKFGAGHFAFVWDERNMNNTLSYLYSLNKLVDSFLEYCKTNNTTYDFVILSRVDAITYRIPDLNTLNKECFYLSNHHMKWPDLFFIMGQKFVGGLKTYPQIDDIIRRHINTMWNDNCVEQFKCISIMEWCGGNNVFCISLPVRLVRDENNKGDEVGLEHYGLTPEERYERV